MDRRKRTRGLLMLLMGVFWVAGCGGGVTTSPAPVSGGAAEQTTAVALRTAGSLASGTSIGGLGITVSLPDSVSVKLDGSGNVDSSVVATSGVAAGQATVIVLYEAATVASPAKLHIALASSTSGMTVGEFAQVTCIVSKGNTPASSDFSISDFAPVDTYGAAIPSLSANLASVSP